MITINSENITQDVQQAEFVRLILQTALAFIFLAFIIIAIMYFHNIRSLSKQRIENKVSKIFEDLLIQYINLDVFETEKKDHILSKINSFLWSAEYKIILKKNISSLNKLFQGEMKDKVEKLYISLGLYHETISNLNSKKWSKKVSALNELREMNIEGSREIIKKLVLDKNQRVSIIAMQTLMNIDNHPFKFLTEHELPLSKAQMIFIAKKASIMKESEHNDILTLFKNQEPTIILLALHMCEILNLKQALTDIQALLKHSNIDIQIQAFITLAKLDETIYYHTLQNYSEHTSIEKLKKLIKVSDSRFVPLSNKINTLVLNTIALKEQKDNSHNPLYNCSIV